MASSQSTIELIFKGIDQASGVTTEVAGGLNKITAAVTSVTAPLAGLTETFLKFEAAALAIGVALVKVAVDDAAKFQSSFNFITTLFETTGDASEKFRSDILDYAQTSTQSLASINTSLQTAIGQGVEYQAALGLLSEAEKLAVAQGASLDDTTKLLVSTLNAYGLSIDDAKTLSDQFSVTIRDGAISAADLAHGLSEITPIAAAVGVGVDQVGAALAVLTANGVPANQAITGVRNILESIINPTDSASKKADELGVAFNATALESTGLSGVLDAVKTATGGNVTKMAELFTTTEGLQAALLLTANNGGKLKDELGKMKDASGTTDEAFKKMAENIELGGQKVSNAITVAFINLGTPLLDEFSNVQSSLASIFTTIGTSFESGVLNKITTALEGLADDVASYLTIIAENLPEALEDADLSGFTNAIDLLRDALKAAFEAMDLDTAEGLSTLITNLGQGFESLTTFSLGVVSALGPIIAKLIELGNYILNLDPATLDFAGTVGGWSIALTAVSPVLTTLLLGIQTFGGSGGVALKALGAEFTALSTVLSTGGLAAALGTAGIAGAVAVLAFEITQLTGLDQTLNDILVPDGLAGYQGATLGTVLFDLAEKLGLVGPAATDSAQKIAVLPPAFAEETAAAQATRTEINAWLDAQETAAKTAVDSKASMDALTSSFAANGYAYDALTGKVTKLAESFEPFSDIKPIPDNVIKESYLTNIEGAVAINGALVTSYEQIGGGTVKATGAFKSVGDSAKDQAAKVEESVKKANDYQIKMEEIASNERIKTIEAVISLNTAALEADMERVKAAFASLDNTVNSTGDLIGSLFGNLVDATDAYDKLEIKEQIDLENKRRQDALDLQKKLTEAEIDRINAQKDALNRGDSIIQINGTGLAPQLEAFMWEILKAIQVRANATFQDYLLGMSIS